MYDRGDAYRACRHLVLKHAPFWIKVGPAAGSDSETGTEQLTKKEERRIVALRKQGHVMREIADEVRRSHTSVYNVLQRHNLTGRLPKTQPKKKAA